VPSPDGLPRVLALRDLDQVRHELATLRVAVDSIERMAGKALFRAVRLKGVDVRAATILKQEMLARGGDVAISRDAEETSRDADERGGSRTDCLLLGTVAQYDRLLPELRAHPFGLDAMAASLAAALSNWAADAPETHPGLDLDHGPRLMGIVNVTPDSFSDPGVFFHPRAAIAGAWRLVEEGAHLIDVGGESTRPGSDPTSLEEELARVMPFVRALAGELTVPISVDTYKAAVAAQAIEAGALMVNDQSALRMDPEMVAVVRDADCPVVLMHMLGRPKTMQVNPVYDDVVAEVYAFFVERLNWAVDQGIPERNLLIDPGIGFGKTLAHNLTLLRDLETFRSLGRPVVLGHSRKRFVGELLGLPDGAPRALGTAVVSALAATKRVSIIRVHDVRENAQAVRMAQAVHTGG
jgi:dihydropteroate synthase